MPDVASDGGSEGGVDGGSDASVPDPIILRIVDHERAALSAELIVATADGERRLTGSSVTLTADELRAGVDVYMAAEGFAPTGIAGFRSEDFALLPTVEEQPAWVMMPSWTRDPIRLRENLPALFRVATLPFANGGGWARSSRDRLLVERSGLETILIDPGAFSPFERCPYRFDLEEGERLAEELFVDITDPRVVQAECAFSELEVQPRDGVEVGNVFARRGLSLPIAVGAGFPNPYELFRSRQRVEADGSFFVELPSLLGELPVSNHPASDLPVETVVTIQYRNSSDPRVETFVSIAPSLEDFPNPLRVPEVLPEEPELVFEPPPGESSGGLYLLSSFGDVPIPAVPSLDTPVHMVIGTAGVLVAPGADLPLGRAVEALLELAGPSAFVDREAGRDRFLVYLNVCDELSFEPVPYCRFARRALKPVAASQSFEMYAPVELLDSPM